jgi:hypothetical protein
MRYWKVFIGVVCIGLWIESMVGVLTGHELTAIWDLLAIMLLEKQL